MANIKISELNELTQKAYDDYIPVVDSSANETKKISVEKLIPSNVNLIAVTDTAPSTYETGDKYYNTETGKIYTATGSGWANAEDPISDILYIVLSEQKSYTYDGTDLISVGGGAGGSVTVAPDEPTEDTKLYIESTDLDFQGLEISNEYNTANNVAYSCNYVNGINGKLLWTNSNPSSSFSSQNITLNSSDYDMYEIIYSNYKGEDYYMTSGRTPKGHGKRIMMNTGSSTNGPYTFRRDITYNSATSLGVSTCYVYYGSTESGSNDDLIPLYVIGYKTGLFS